MDELNPTGVVSGFSDSPPYGEVSKRAMATFFPSKLVVDDDELNGVPLLNSDEAVDDEYDDNDVDDDDDSADNTDEIDALDPPFHCRDASTLFGRSGMGTTLTGSGGGGIRLSLLS